jgi:hypothetical protein
MKLTATREVRYAGVNYYEGDKFEASDKDAKLLIAIKKATAGDIKRTVDLPAEVLSRAVHVEEDAAPANFTKRRYRRRDLSAE